MAQIVDQVTSDGRRLPKHYLLKQRLIEQIDGFPAGTALKAERVLSEELGASRSTIRQALLELAVEGRVVRMQGRGTFVAPPKDTLPLRLRSYTEEWRDRDRSPGSRLLDIRVEPAEPAVAEHLELQPGVPVLRLERLRLTDGVPMALEVAQLDAVRFEGLVPSMSDDVSLYELLSQRWGVEPDSAVQTIETVLAAPIMASLLETESSTPVLLLTRTTKDAAGRPFEYVRAVYRGDRYRFVATLTRR